MSQEIKDRIIHLLSEVVERSNTMNQKSGGPLNLEIDLIMEDLRMLYREFEWFRKQISDPESSAFYRETMPPAQVSTDLPDNSEPPVKETPQPAEAMPDVDEVVSTPKFHHIAEEIIEAPRQPAAEPVASVKSAIRADENENTLKEKITSNVDNTLRTAVSGQVNLPAENMQVSSKPGVNLPPQGITKTRIADRFASEDNSLHKRLAAQKEDRSLGARLQLTPISSLKDAIGVNEKFLFINELFGGNIQVYNEAIARLNAFQNIDQSFEYLNDLSKTLEWDENRSSQTIEKLAGFVMRRYLAR
ncbi:MAG TPA: hypothetical protein VLH61_10850 [Bacteroidales bacterium]|nr:hypothetical protein [Bacteroidales bacterium]